MERLENNVFLPRKRSALTAIDVKRTLEILPEYSG